MTPAISVREEYQLVQLGSGAYSIHAIAEDETFHPVIGPVAEAEALYVEQLHLRQRLSKQTGEFVIWDVGLGSGANALTVLAASHDIPCQVRLLSFDRTIKPLEFGLRHADRLEYFNTYQEPVRHLLHQHCARFANGQAQVTWDLHLDDFPTVASSMRAQNFPKPHAILFDAFSPAKNPEMWTQPLFTTLYQLLDPLRPCALATYSRSTMLRVSLLLGGFFVGSGSATGEKEETTIAANAWELLPRPLGAEWLKRARNSTSAEPLWDSHYRQAPLSAKTWNLLQNHPQFSFFAVPPS